MDTTIKAIIAFSGGNASFLFGGWSTLLTILVAFVVIDYASVVATAAKEGKGYDFWNCHCCTSD